MVDRPRIGTVFAGYRIEGAAGRGGASLVYLATNLKLGNRVALKVLSPELGEDDTFRERFVRESQIAAQLNHPNIIPIYDAGADGDYLYIAMRYVEGADLRAQIAEQGALPVERTMRIIGQVSRALDTAHARGLVHRDVKPANVLLEEVGKEHEHAYLADFGLTKRTGSHTGLTGSGHFIGTIDYMAPEQIEGGDVDSRADVYALACMVYQCLTGVVPFPKDAELAVLWAHMNEAPPSVSSLRPEVPPSVDAVIARGMSKQRDERYDTCEQLVSALNDALGLSGASSTVTPPTPVGAETSVAPAPPPPRPEPEPAPPVFTATTGGSDPRPRESRRGGIPGPRWGRIAAVAGAIVALGAAALAAHQLTGGSASGSAGGGAPMTDTNLQHYVSAELWQAYSCRRQTPAVPPSLPTSDGTANAGKGGLLDSALCPDGPGIHVQLALYGNSAQSEGAWLRLEAPYRLGRDNGERCDRHGLDGASGTWKHGAHGEMGGLRFCQVEPDGQGVVVWTLRSGTTPDSLPHSVLAVAQQDKGQKDFHLTQWWKGCRHHFGEGMMGVAGMGKCAM
jgi:serine/threonine protein kinase